MEVNYFKILLIIVALYLQHVLKMVFNVLVKKIKKTNVFYFFYLTFQLKTCNKMVQNYYY